MNLAIRMKPTEFHQIIGQDKTIQALENKLKNNDIAVGYLFYGPTGTGKTTISELLANKISSQVATINIADDTGVDNIRKLIENSLYKPMAGERKVYILEEVQQLTNQAQQCLLKPLEDKESSTTWILNTTDPDKLLKALKDRCLSFKLNPLNDFDVKKLVYTAMATVEEDRNYTDFLIAVTKSNLCLPREILCATERWLSGFTPEEAVQSIDDDPQYVDIAKDIVKGIWPKEKLLKIKPADAKGLRICVSGFLRNQLLTNQGNSAIIASTLEKLCLYTAYESGLDLSALVSIIYTHYQKVKGIK